MNINSFFVPKLHNPGILAGKLPDELFNRVKNVAHDPASREVPFPAVGFRTKEMSFSDILVANINEEYKTPEIRGLREYIDSMYIEWRNYYGTSNCPYVINPIWTNYMKKGEYIPNHFHRDGLVAFVIWVTIPYDIEEEKRFKRDARIDLKYSTSASGSKGSCFEFTYTTMEGRIANHPIFVDKLMEGTVIMFPSNMIHCVYPFFTSDEERISIAGNIQPLRK